MGPDGDAGDASAAAVGGVAGDEVTVHIRHSNGSKFSVLASLDSTVGAFKAALADKCEIPAEQQRLIYKGRILKNEQTLKSYGVELDHTIHLVRGFAAPSASPDATTTNNGVSRASNNTTGDSSDGRGSSGGDFGDSLFPDLGVNGLGGAGVSGLLGFGFPDFDQVQQQLNQNPGMMRDIVNMPIIQNLISNPEILRNIVMNNPQMREIIDRNPDVAHLLNDPNSLRQSLEVMRNPELMREMMRNTDRAMSNIESSPEGFNMLRRMYETVQEPFLNATTMAGNTGSDAGSNPFATLLGNQGDEQARDEPPNPSATASDVTAGSTGPNSNPLPNPWSSAGAQTTNPRPSRTSSGRAAGVAGLGGRGLPELQRMVGSVPDPSFLSQVMQNPAMVQMMQSLLSNPQLMNQFLNPQLRSVLDSNSQVRDMLQNPELIRQLTSPEMLQQLLSFQQTLISQLSRQQSSQEQNQTAGTAGTANSTGLEFFMNMLGGLGGAGGLGVPSNPDVPPEELYATQLSQLQEMGFFDTQENIRALRATAGNVHAAVERLLGNPDR